MSKAKRRKGFAKAVLHNMGYTTPAQLSTITITRIENGYLYFMLGAKYMKADINGVMSSDHS